MVDGNVVDAVCNDVVSIDGMIVTKTSFFTHTGPQRARQHVSSTLQLVPSKHSVMVLSKQMSLAARGQRIAGPNTLSIIQECDFDLQETYSLLVRKR